MQNVIRVLIAKPGLDGHDRGAKVVARALRDAGFEVIYTGLHQTPEMVVSSALQEDVDVIGLSILSGAHIPLVEAILKLMKKEGLSKLLFVGGIIPDDDAKLLEQKGVFRVFGPGTSLSDIATSITQAIVSGKNFVQKEPHHQTTRVSQAKKKLQVVSRGASRGTELAKAKKKVQAKGRQIKGRSSPKLKKKVSATSKSKKKRKSAKF